MEIVSKEREWAILGDKGIILIRGNWDYVNDLWEDTEKGLLVEILEEK